jgi:hypothetical protein
MVKFSERYGLVPVRSVLQINDIDTSLRNKLWNITRTTFFDDAPKFKGNADDILSIQDRPRDLFEDIWHSYFKEPVDTVGGSYFDALNNVRKHFMECSWYEVYDFLEFLSNPPPNKEFFDVINQVLKDEIVGHPANLDVQGLVF